MNSDSHAFDAADSEAMFMDAQPDTPVGEVCFGTLTYDTICYANTELPSNTRNITNQVLLRSDDDTSCDPNALGVPDVCVISADKMIVSGTGRIQVTGMRPVIFLATGADGINLNTGSILDAGSTTITQGASGLATCAGSTAATENGGGFGGSFVAAGGKGGKDQAGNGASAPATVLGTPTTLHGGCPGGIGASGSAVATSAAGRGGGAIVLVASVIVIDGLVTAYGGGGHGNLMFAGGGGGGAGGMIVLDAALIKGNGEVNVKGGGGGGGAGGNSGGDGHDGYDAAMRMEDGAGGSDNSMGGDGGHGGPHGANVSSGEDGMDGSGGGPSGGPGGGGGGGAQGVVVTTSVPTGTLSGAN